VLVGIAIPDAGPRRTGRRLVGIAILRSQIDEARAEFARRTPK
jgi:hypothetical protein